MVNIAVLEQHLSVPLYLPSSPSPLSSSPLQYQASGKDYSLDPSWDPINLERELHIPTIGACLFLHEK